MRSQTRTLEPTIPEADAPRAGADGREAINVSGHTALHVPPGWTEMSGYVRAHRLRFATAERMALGDVREKYDMLMGENQWRPGYQLSPPPKGYWEQDEEDGAWNFVILDGRHRALAALMWGYRHVLVRWNHPPTEAEDDPRDGA